VPTPEFRYHQRRPPSPQPILRWLVSLTPSDAIAGGVIFDAALSLYKYGPPSP
jgi:hypothetical protein